MPSEHKEKEATGGMAGGGGGGGASPNEDNDSEGKGIVRRRKEFAKAREATGNEKHTQQRSCPTWISDMPLRPRFSNVPLRRQVFGCASETTCF
jgi:hypothetical protein